MEAGKLKQRLVGAAVLLSIAAIILPLLLSGRNDSGLQETIIPEQPERVAQPEIIPREAEEHPPAEPPSESAEVRVIEAPEPKETPAPVKDTPKPDEPPKQAIANAPATTLPPASDLKPAVPAWVVQVGSFSQEANALQLRDRLRKDGYAAYVERVQAGAAPVFRVRVGPELDRERAEQVRDRLAREQKLTGMVQQHR